MMQETADRWAAFKAKREYQRRRDEEIKEIIKDAFGLLEVVALFGAAWFFLAVLYA